MQAEALELLQKLQRTLTKKQDEDEIDNSGGFSDGLKFVTVQMQPNQSEPQYATSQHQKGGGKRGSHQRLPS